LFAVALLPYGVPPRCDELCDQLLFPPPRFPVLMFVFRLKLLLTFMLTLLLPPQPQRQHEPPQNAAPIMTPAVKVKNAAPAVYGG
jgi:hypothetical protein